MWSCVTERGTHSDENLSILCGLVRLRVALAVMKSSPKCYGLV